MEKNSKNFQPKTGYKPKRNSRESLKIEMYKKIHINQAQRVIFPTMTISVSSLSSHIATVISPKQKSNIDY